MSIALVVIVIFVFLKSAAATLIPALALPVSLIGACAFMYVFGYSIDNISLLAITLSVGFVVDDAIVMLENITRHIEAGMKPFDAALKGSQGDRVHDYLDHLLAGGGVHSRAADGRRRRARLPRIRRDDHGGDPRLRLRFADADADAVRANPERAQARQKRRPVLAPLRFLCRQSRTGYRVTLDVVLKFRFVTLLATFATACVAVFALCLRFPRGSFPTKTPASCAASPRRSPTPASAKCRRAGRGSRIVAKGPGGRERHFGGRLRRRDQQGLPVHQAEGQAASADPMFGDHEPPARQRTSVHSRHPHDHAAGAESRIHRRAALRAPNINTRCNRATSTRSIR